jgi:hypothetical protein
MSLPEDIQFEILKILPMLTYVRTVNVNPKLMRLAEKRLTERHREMIYQSDLYKRLYTISIERMLEVAVEQNDADVFQLITKYPGKKFDVGRSKFIKYHIEHENYSVIDDIIGYFDNASGMFYSAVQLDKMNVAKFLIDKYVKNLSYLYVPTIYLIDKTPNYDFVKLYLERVSTNIKKDIMSLDTYCENKNLRRMIRSFLRSY